jgi:hypothetical protein
LTFLIGAGLGSNSFWYKPLLLPVLSTGHYCATRKRIPLNHSSTNATINSGPRDYHSERGKHAHQSPSPTIVFRNHPRVISRGKG